MFETRYYIVDSISGDYAYLRLADSNDTIQVAMALLPVEIEEGTKVKYENLSYVID